MLILDSKTFITGKKVTTAQIGRKIVQFDGQRNRTAPAAYRVKDMMIDPVSPEYFGQGVRSEE
ncbi:MAG: hypothetical protein EHM32_07515 [Spirochaetales bacterium]|nr:MAG: hypothetical protein EHM32_07515 [Spirochaetales bacterium]